METYSVSANHLVSSSILFPPFSDQSHVDFYHLSGSTSLAYPSLSFRSSPCRALSSIASWKPAVPPLRAFSESACASQPLDEPTSEQTSLMKELADLKLQMKLKKKELKSQKKDEKQRLKMQVKEEKKAMKQKDGTERKKKKKCLSESSSSSESSDGECESMSIRVLRQEQPLSVDYDGVPVRGQEDRNAVDVCEGSRGRASAVAVMERLTGSMSCVAEEGLSAIAIGGLESREISVLKDMQGQGVLSAGRRLPSNSASVLALNRIEVCAGGKCKKAGSEQLLSLLTSQIPSSSDVVAVPCKCMGKCAMAMNVKVHKEDSNPQHHSHVRVEDVDVILNHHFGLGCAPTGLPSFPSQDTLRVPSLMSV